MGLKKAKSDYIILIDCDLPYFDKFNLLVKKLKEGHDFVAINKQLEK